MEMPAVLIKIYHQPLTGTVIKRVRAYQSLRRGNGGTCPFFKTRQLAGNRKWGQQLIEVRVHPV